MKTRLLKMISIGTFGGLLYVLLEYLWRGYSHPTMFLLAFFVSQILMILNDTILPKDTYYEVQVLMGTFYCCVFEHVFGVIFNSNYTIWDYRSLPFTLHWTNDQVNLMFCLLWLFICMWGIPLMDFIQWKTGLGDKPRYRFWIIENFLRRKGD